MMDDIFNGEDEEESLSAEEKDSCQNLLLTMSLKEKMFSEDQRKLAKKFLKRLEGDRRRRCRTSEQPRFQPGLEADDPVIPRNEKLMITGKKKKKRRKRSEMLLDDDEPATPKARRGKDPEKASGYLGEDGYLHHSDSDLEADWSDVGDDLYQAGGKKKDRISRKESQRRRHWSMGDDSATAAGRAWPVFPRHVVKDVLSTVLDAVIKDDEDHGGIFSVPVPKDDFPDYYDQIEKPMDYSTMKAKLDNGEYRSAQGMQKDFVLILQNCRQYNSNSSDIVKEARRQHLHRPKLLKEAASKHNLFLAEDGSVLEIFDEEKKTPEKRTNKRKKGEAEGEEEPVRKKRRKKGEGKAEEEDAPAVANSDAPTKKKRRRKKGDAVTASKPDSDEEAPAVKPRLKLKIRKSTSDVKVDKDKKRQKRKSTEIADDSSDPADDNDDEIPIPKKRRKSEGKTTKKRAAKSSSEVSNTAEVDDSVPLEDKTVKDSKFLDLAYWKTLRKGLDGTFDSARSHVTHLGPWELPGGLTETAFTEVATATLTKMDKIDRHDIFAEEVTDEDVPGYSEVVTSPMDFTTMRSKIDNGTYGVGANAIGALRDDFLLVFDNCHLFNDEDSDVHKEAVKVMSQLPEAFVAACVSVSGKGSSL